MLGAPAVLISEILADRAAEQKGVLGVGRLQGSCNNSFTAHFVWLPIEIKLSSGFGSSFELRDSKGAASNGSGRNCALRVSNRVEK